jgi:hypothetical protein
MTDKLTFPHFAGPISLPLEFQKSLVVYWLEREYMAQKIGTKLSARPNMEVSGCSSVMRWVRALKIREDIEEGHMTGGHLLDSSLDAKIMSEFGFFPCSCPGRVPFPPPSSYVGMKQSTWRERCMWSWARGPTRPSQPLQLWRYGSGRWKDAMISKCVIHLPEFQPITGSIFKLSPS